jgi:hypothetical protein
MHPRFDDGAEVCAIAPVAWCGVATTVGSSGDQSIDAAEARANARLIAAAPDLLAALERLERLSWSALAPDDPVRVSARAAIAKAKDATKEKP